MTLVRIFGYFVSGMKGKTNSEAEKHYNQSYGLYHRTLDEINQSINQSINRLISRLTQLVKQSSNQSNASSRQTKFVEIFTNFPCHAFQFPQRTANENYIASSAGELQ